LWVNYFVFGGSLLGWFILLIGWWVGLVGSSVGCLVGWNIG